MIISGLTDLPLRVLWKYEAQGFTQWLADNLDFLSTAISVNPGKSELAEALHKLNLGEILG